MFCIVVVLYVTSIPILASLIYYMANERDALLIYYLFPLSTTVFYTNGMINCYVYLYKNEHFRMRRRASKKSRACSLSF